MTLSQGKKYLVSEVVSSVPTSPKEVIILGEERMAGEKVVGESLEGRGTRNIILYFSPKVEAWIKSLRHWLHHCETMVGVGQTPFLWELLPGIPGKVQR